MTKLLLIMHDEALALAYRTYLSKAGFEIQQASTGHMGLQKARHWAPDIIVLDVVLPGLNGLDVLKCLRDVPWLLSVPVALLIDHTLAPDVLQQCMMWGVSCSFFRKDLSSVSDFAMYAEELHQAFPHQSASQNPFSQAPAPV